MQTHELTPVIQQRAYVVWMTCWQRHPFFPLPFWESALQTYKFIKQNIMKTRWHGRAGGDERIKHVKRIMLAAQEDTGYMYLSFLAAEHGVITLLKI